MTTSATHEPDERTLRKLRAGDVAALESLFTLFGLRVHRLASRMMGSAADAEDATQEIFLRAFEQADKFDGRSRFSTWLYRLAVRHCLNKLRSRRRRRVAEHAAAEDARVEGNSDSAGWRAEQNDDLALATELLVSLPPNHRACIVLREVEGLNYTEMAELLEVPVGTVMSRLARARQVLRVRHAEISENDPRGGNARSAGGVQRTEGSVDDDVP